ncbi:MAG: hypothetical protein C0475_07830 [Planctomyces sp.]|nr:hypothetical protein [Planctomyces sp.]
MGRNPGQGRRPGPAPAPAHARPHQQRRTPRTPRTPPPAPALPMTDGYRHEPGPGPRLRADVVDVYIVRGAWGQPQPSRAPQLLLIKRAKPPLLGTWHPVMGHIEPGERAWQAAAREASEETALDVWAPPCAGFFALEQVHPFYIAALDCVVLSPRFLALVEPPWEPTLNHEHSAARWVQLDEAHSHVTWPGQRAALAEIRDALSRSPSPHSRPHADPGRQHAAPMTLDLLRLPPPTR